MLPRLQYSATAMLLCLVAVIVITEIWLMGMPVSRLWLSLTVLPLLLALRGFLHGKRYTFQWMSLVIWLYFAAGVVRIWLAASLVSLGYGILETTLALGLFALCCAYARMAAPSRQK